MTRPAAQLGTCAIPDRPWSRRFASAALCLVALLEGCGAGWHRPADLAPGALGARQQVQVWQQGTALRWHAVIVAPDSVSGIPFLQPIDCDSCRVTVAREAVDSIRLGNPVAGFWQSVGLVMGGLVAFCALACPRAMN